MPPSPETGNGPAAARGGAGCFGLGALFVFVAIIAWFAAVLIYGVVVQQWGWIKVRREFEFDWVFFYAPLFAIGLGLAAAFGLGRRASAARLTILAVTAGLVALVAGVLLFGLGGLI